jgi:patatin-like phospholipase/acyl hydrolase
MTVEELSANSGAFVSAIDGGLFANDPSLCSLTEAFKLYPNSDAYFILSIGTGKRDQIAIADPKTLLGWAMLAPEMLMSNAERMVRHMIKTLGLMYSKKVFFLKIQVSLPMEHASMDDTSPANIEYLKQRARDYIAHPNSPINNLIDLLKIPSTQRKDLVQIPGQRLTTNFIDLSEGFTL